MTNWLIIAALAFLSGCAVYSPQGIRNMGERSEIQSAFDATTLARCMAKNAEQYRTTSGNAFKTSLRPGGTAGSWEMIVTVAVWDSTAAVSDIVPRQSGGAVATVWNHGYDLLPKVMAEGCS